MAEEESAGATAGALPVGELDPDRTAECLPEHEVETIADAPTPDHDGVRVQLENSESFDTKVTTADSEDKQVEGTNSHGLESEDQNAVAAEQQYQVEAEESGGRIPTEESGDDRQNRLDNGELPPEIEKLVKVLHYKSEETGSQSTVYIVGTTHVSKESCEEVKRVIRYIRPKAVFLELCKSRLDVVNQLKKAEVPSFKRMLKVLRDGKMNIFGVSYSYFLAKVSQKMDVIPGGEFRTAFQEEQALNGSIILGDRPIHITLQRTWSRMSFWNKVWLLWTFFVESLTLPSAEEFNRMLEELSETDVLTALVQEYSKRFPTLMETLVTERDLFMTWTLEETAQRYSSVVAVVGRGHLQGIVANWGKPIEVEPLLIVPDKKKSRKLWAAGIAVCGIAIGLGIYMTRH